MGWKAFQLPLIGSQAPARSRSVNRLLALYKTLLSCFNLSRVTQFSSKTLSFRATFAGKSHVFHSRNSATSAENPARIRRRKVAIRARMSFVTATFASQPVRGSSPGDGEYAEVSEFVSAGEARGIRDGIAASGMTREYALALGNEGCDGQISKQQLADVIGFPERHALNRSTQAVQCPPLA
jgi:hypothetical protein